MWRGNEYCGKLRSSTRNLQKKQFALTKRELDEGV
jgi:hypothetical protein